MWFFGVEAKHDVKVHEPPALEFGNFQITQPNLSIEVTNARVRAFGQDSPEVLHGPREEATGVRVPEHSSFVVKTRRTQWCTEQRIVSLV